MIARHEAVVGSRFDALHHRFKRDVARDDPRLLGIVDNLGPMAGRRVLDLGCGKGRFSRTLSELGARVIGLDLSAAMLAEAVDLDRVRASARRLPFASASFDRVVAVEVFEHLAPRSVDQVCDEVCRVLRPGGTFVIVDKNVWSWNAQRPWLPSCGGEMDRRAPGSVDVFAPRERARALVSSGRAEPAAGAMVLGGPGRSPALARRAGPVPVSIRCRHATFRAVGGSSAGRVRVTELYSPLLASFPLLLWKTPPGLELILAQEGVAFETVKDAHPLSFRGGRFVLFDSRAVPSSAIHGLLTSGHVLIDVDSLRRDEPVDPFEALIDQQAARSSWTVGPYTLSERLARFPKAWIRRRLIDKLRRGRHGVGRLVGPPGLVSLPVSFGFQLPRRPRRAGAR